MMAAVVGALAAGVPLRQTSELTPLSTLRLAEMMNQIFPKRVVQVLHGGGNSVSPSSIIQRWRGFPSQVPAQAYAMRAASQQIKHVHLNWAAKPPSSFLMMRI